MVRGRNDAHPLAGGDEGHELFEAGDFGRDRARQAVAVLLLEPVRSPLGVVRMRNRDEGVGGELGQRDRGAAGEAVAAREGRESLFASEDLDLEVGLTRAQARERHVHRAGDHPGYVAELQLLDEDLDVRASLRIGVEDGGQQAGPGRAGEADDEAILGPGRRQGPLGLAQGSPALTQQRDTGLGELDATAGANQQRDADLRLQTADLLAERGLGDMQSLGRTAEVQLLRDRNEIFELTQIEAIHRQKLPVVARRSWTSGAAPATLNDSEAQRTPSIWRLRLTLHPGQPPQAFAVDYEQAPAYWSIGILWNVLISAERSFGQFTLMDQTMPEGAGPPLLMHERMAEGFYILDGEIRYEVGAEKTVTIARAGTAVWIPPGTPHSFKVTSETARALNFYTPGGFDDQFPFLATPAAEKTLPPADGAGPPDAEQREAYVDRLRDLHQETGLTGQQIW